MHYKVGMEILNWKILKKNEFSSRIYFMVRGKHSVHLVLPVSDSLLTIFLSGFWRT